MYHNADCHICLDTNCIVNDFSSGDCTCISCGSIINRECEYQASYDNLSHIDMYNKDDSIGRKINTISKKYDLEISNHNFFIHCVQNFIDRYPSHDFKLVVCCVYMYEKYQTINNTIIHEMSKKIKASSKSIRECLGKLNTSNEKKKGVAMKEEEEYHRSEWIDSLQKECLKFLFDNENYTRQTIQLVKKECEHIIMNKAECIFHSLDYVAASIIKHKIPEVDIGNKLNKTKISQISNMLYN